MLEQIVFQLRERKLVRGIGEIDRAIRSGVQIVGAAEGHSFSFGCEHAGLSVRRDRHQTKLRIGDDQIAGGIENQSQRTTLGIGEHLGSGAILLKTKDASQFVAAVDAIL